MTTIIIISIFLVGVITAGIILLVQKSELRRNTDNLTDDNKSTLTPNIQNISHKLEHTIRAELDLEYKTKLLEAQSQLRDQETLLHTQISELKTTLTQREVALEAKYQSLEEERHTIETLKNELRSIKSTLLEKKEELDTAIAKHKKDSLTALESIAQYSQTEAKNHILSTTQEEMGNDLLQWQQKYLEQYQDEAYFKAREIIALALQRCSSEVANEFTITTIHLKNEDEKGKIIGKAGRNIQWLEKILGVELIIDDTPEIITISGFSSIRRHIAKHTIELLLADGRIHPSSIEEMHEKAKAHIAQDIADAGQWAVNELGIIDFPAKLTRLIGRLKFRTSYGQNMLKHSVEMAKLAALIAHDFNTSFPTKERLVDVDICIKGALLHDIGKGVDEDIKPKTSHITLGERICDTFNLDWRIKKCISSHHDESYYDKDHGFCIEAAIVDACDNLSGGRSGARKETAEAYYQRMEELETIANNTEGVTKSWIMRGSRELWVFFDTEKITPSDMHTTVKAIAQRIQTGINYPGEIKIIGFWEDKIIEYAH